MAELDKYAQCNWITFNDNILYYLAYLSAPRTIEDSIEQCWTTIKTILFEDVIMGTYKAFRQISNYLLEVNIKGFKWLENILYHLTKYSKKSFYISCDLNLWS